MRSKKVTQLVKALIPVLLLFILLSTLSPGPLTTPSYTQPSRVLPICSRFVGNCPFPSSNSTLTISTTRWCWLLTRSAICSASTTTVTSHVPRDLARSRQPYLGECNASETQAPFAHNLLFSSCLIVSKFCTDYGNDTNSAKFQNNALVPYLIIHHFQRKCEHFCSNIMYYGICEIVLGIVIVMIHYIVPLVLQMCSHMIQRSNYGLNTLLQKCVILHHFKSVYTRIFATVIAILTP